MKLSLNKNLMGALAQSKLAESTAELNSTIERLSSGLRINKPSDDPGGLAIMDVLAANTSVFTQAVRNLNDGIGQLNVANDALNQLTSIMTRIGELAEQAANGVLFDDQRVALDEEANALEAEYVRIIESTEFNGVDLLNGTQSEVTYQAGYAENGSITAALPDISVEEGVGSVAASTERVSLDTTGSDGNNSSSSASISSDGRYIAFASSASDLVAGDTNGVGDVFVRDTQTGTTTRVSVDSVGGQSNATSGSVGISADGRYVTFSSDASNLVAGDTNGAQDIFRHDTVTGTTIRVSVDSVGGEGNNDSQGASISADGRYVTFTSLATDLVAGDTNGSFDAFVHDTVTGATTRVSVDSVGGQSDAHSHLAVISGDGRYVAFESEATNLVAGDTNASRDVFLHDTVTGGTTRVSVDSLGAQGDFGGWKPAVSSDGRYIAFYSSSTNLIAGDTNGFEDVFVKDTLTGTVTRASVDSDGNQSNGGAASPPSLSISGDGRYVAFESLATNLVAGDTNGTTDVFLHDTQSGTTERVSVDSLGGEANGSSGGPSISSNGSYIAYSSQATNLVADDTNGFFDVFRSANTLAGGGGIAGIDLRTEQAARDSLTAVEGYLKAIAEAQGEIAASLNRVTQAVNHTAALRDNYQEAHSKISSIDVAEEVANLARLQVLQQAQTAVTAQANQSHALVLQLIQS